MRLTAWGLFLYIPPGIIVKDLLGMSPVYRASLRATADPHKSHDSAPFSAAPGQSCTISCTKSISTKLPKYACSVAPGQRARSVERSR